jgi:hypothetical protein
MVYYIMDRRVVHPSTFFLNKSIAKQNHREQIPSSSTYMVGDRSNHGQCIRMDEMCIVGHNAMRFDCREML